MTIPQDVRVECIRLRTKDQLSIAEICLRTGVSKGTISNMLVGYPLKRKRRHNPWNKGKRSYDPEKSKWADAIDALSPNDRGKVAEAAVLFRLCVHGVSVYGSPFDGDSADWMVLRDDGVVFKIQVKLCKGLERGRPVIELRSSSKKVRYRFEDFDFIVGYDPIEDVCYVFSVKEVANNKAAVSATDESKEAWGKIVGA